MKYMKTRIKIEGISDEEKGELRLNKSSLSVLHLVIAITALTKMLFNDMDEEDHEVMRKLLKDIAEDPEEELKKQFEAIRVAKLLKSLRELGEVLEDDEEDEYLN